MRTFISKIDKRLNECLSCRITNQSERYTHYLSLVLPSVIVTLVAFGFYFLVFVWVYCCTCNSCAPNSPQTLSPIDPYYPHDETANNTNDNYHQQHLLNSNNSSNCNPNGGPVNLPNRYEVNLSIYKQHVLSMTVLLMLFVATWLFAQSLDLQTFDFVFCFANVTQSWLFFSEKCILLSEAREAWRRFFSNGEVRNSQDPRNKFVHKDSPLPTNEIAGVVTRNGSVMTAPKDELDKAALFGSHTVSTSQRNNNHCGSQHSIVSKHGCSSPVPPFGNTSPSPTADMQLKNQMSATSLVYDATLRSCDGVKDSTVLKNGKVQTARNSAPNKQQAALNLSNDSGASFGTLSALGALTNSDPNFSDAMFRPASRDCLEGGDAYGASYLQSPNNFGNNSPSCIDSDPNRESYV